MKTTFGAFVMILGVVLMAWPLYGIYHHLPISGTSFGAGLILALVGAGWVEGKSSRPI